MPENVLHHYNNGNCQVTLYEDGTRIVETLDPSDDSIRLDLPLNVDIRVTNFCSFGAGSPVGCRFCHESAVRVGGTECDYIELSKILSELPDGVELAVGCNELSEGLERFIRGHTRFVINLTVNQGHIPRFAEKLRKLILDGCIRGLGISYRGFLSWKIPEDLLKHENTIFHVIAGIDKVEDVLHLKELGVRKLLILGEKDFGFNLGKVDLESESHKKWRANIFRVLKSFEVVAFDNLALEQLPIKKFVPPKLWDELYQGEHSLYVDAVHRVFKRSSRVAESQSWDSTTLTKFFKEFCYD